MSVTQELESQIGMAAQRLATRDGQVNAGLIEHFKRRLITAVAEAIVKQAEDAIGLEETMAFQSMADAHNNAR